MFGLWTKKTAPCFMDHDNPVQNVWITTEL